MGFGHSSHIHTTRVLRLTQLPIVIEIVDAEERIRSLGSRIDRSSVPMVPFDGAGKAI
jgi:PII-like signaling protein